MLVPNFLSTVLESAFFMRDSNIIIDRSTKAFTKLLLVSKLLLASIRGGKHRADATEKLLRNRLARWKAGHIRSLWEDVRGAYQRNNTRQKIQHASPQPNTDERESKLVTEAVLRKVRLLVEGGQLSRACQRLLSRGVASYDEENFAKGNLLFPATTEPTTGYMEGREDPTPTIILEHDIAKYTLEGRN